MSRSPEQLFRCYMPINKHEMLVDFVEAGILGFESYTSRRKGSGYGKCMRKLSKAHRAHPLSCEKAKLVKRKGDPPYEHYLLKGMPHAIITATKILRENNCKVETDLF